MHFQTEKRYKTVLAEYVAADHINRSCAYPECESHRTISLMSHIIKILLKLLMDRMRNKITPEIAEEQCGFVQDK